MRPVESCRLGDKVELRCGERRVVAGDTASVLEWLLALGGDLAMVGAHMQWTYWLRDLPLQVAEALLLGGKVQWGPYTLSWLPYRRLSVEGRGKRATVWDLDSLGIGDRADRRADWGTDDLKAITERISRIQRRWGLRPHWTAGSLARALVRANMGRDWRPRAWCPHDPEWGIPLARCAYYGARIEIAEAIAGTGPWHDYDLRDAYPRALVQVPEWREGRWRLRKGWQPGIGIWWVEWDGLPDGPLGRWAPLPVRRAAHLYWPARGAGWYWSPEVQAALEVGYPVDVQWGYLWDGPSHAHRRYHWLGRWIERRAILERQGLKGPAKLVQAVLRAVCGLTASRRLTGEAGQWSDYLSAGYMTSLVRAQILRALAQAPDTVASVHTDSLLTNGKLWRRRPEGWTHMRVIDPVVVVPGLWWAIGHPPVTAGIQVYRCPGCGEPHIGLRGPMGGLGCRRCYEGSQAVDYHWLRQAVLEGEDIYMYAAVTWTHRLALHAGRPEAVGGREVMVWRIRPGTERRGSDGRPLDGDGMTALAGGWVSEPYHPGHMDPELAWGLELR